MMEIYTIFSLATDNVRFTDGRIFFYPNLNGSVYAGGYISGLSPVLFLKDKDS